MFRVLALRRVIAPYESETPQLIDVGCVLYGACVARLKLQRESIVEANEEKTFAVNSATRKEFRGVANSSFCFRPLAANLANTLESFKPIEMEFLSCLCLALTCEYSRSISAAGLFSQINCPFNSISPFSLFRHIC